MNTQSDQNPLKASQAIKSRPVIWDEDIITKSFTLAVGKGKLNTTFDIEKHCLLSLDYQDMTEEAITALGDLAQERAQTLEPSKTFNYKKWAVRHTKHYLLYDRYYDHIDLNPEPEDITKLQETNTELYFKIALINYNKPNFDKSQLFVNTLIAELDLEDKSEAAKRRAFYSILEDDHFWFNPSSESINELTIYDFITLYELSQYGYWSFILKFKAYLFLKKHAQPLIELQSHEFEEAKRKLRSDKRIAFIYGDNCFDTFQYINRIRRLKAMMLPQKAFIVFDDDEDMLTPASRSSH